ncbi:SDR family oxidoreductase [Kitasatospora sp. NA04385]|uniref:SDR family NAD(P)-dependent oxidoreductase n=1 Tax=Kitasatospora sp. NA04385 TaxID=2742135 RepID=UPI001591ACE4|nr:SDR family NAD(P)-dependent oxidoreductase [Kitasatospora sp. NA04385]QKW17782.1 SDR family oxidoreductase [Kitasatospora sp. NA04385]
MPRESTAAPARSRRTAVVTGAAGGIGSAVVRRLLSAGAHVVCADADPDRLSRLFGADPRVTPRSTDVTDEAAVAALMAEAAARGGFDTLVNTVGLTRRGSLTAISMDEWDLTVDTCLRSAALCARAALPHLVAAGRASLTSVASIHQRVFGPRLPAYTAAKSGLVALTRQLAVDYGPLGVRCNVVSPGYIRSPRTGETPADDEAMAAATPSVRLGRPDDVAAAVAFLAGDDAGFVNGTELVVDGGASLVFGASLVRPALRWQVPDGLTPPADGPRSTPGASAPQEGPR